MYIVIMDAAGNNLTAALTKLSPSATSPSYTRPDYTSDLMRRAYRRQMLGDKIESLPEVSIPYDTAAIPLPPAGTWIRSATEFAYSKVFLRPVSKTDFLGVGAYGSVFRVTAKRAVHRVRDSGLLTDLVWREPDGPESLDDLAGRPDTRYVALKVQKFLPYDQITQAEWDRLPRPLKIKEFRKFLNESVGETSMHLEMMRSPPVALGPGLPTIDLAAFIPRMHFYGLDRRTGMFVTCMELVRPELDADGKRVLQVRRPGDQRSAFQRRPMIAAKIERALLSLHAHGFLHMDAHLNNIFLDAKGNVKLLDFGYARRMPASYVPRVRDALARTLTTLRDTGRWDAGPIDRLWHPTNKNTPGLRNVLERHLAPPNKRPPRFINPNGKMLVYLRTLFEGDSRIDVDRRLVWFGPRRPNPAKRGRNANENERTSKKMRT